MPVEPAGALLCASDLPEGPALFALAVAVDAVAVKSRQAAVSDTYANQGARAGAILPFTSATASLCAAVTVAVVEVLPLLPNLVAQSATAVVFPLFGSLVAAAASVSKARCEVDAQAATAAANELSSVDGDEPINPIGSTVELTRLAVRPILSNLRPRKLWRNIRRKKQE